MLTPLSTGVSLRLITTVDVNGIRAEVKMLESGVNQVRQLVESCQKDEVNPNPAPICLLMQLGIWSMHHPR